MSQEPDVFIYDTTLRDGTQGEGVSFSVSAKVRLAEAMDAFGFDYIEGGWPGSNPRDIAFFEAIRFVELKHAKVAAFGSTRRAHVDVAADKQVKLLLEVETPVVTIFGKTWLLHVTEVLNTTAEENLQMIEDTVRHLVEAGREVIYDAEHYYDGAKDNEEYALQTLEAAVRGGASCLTLCDTNGGTLVPEVQAMTAQVVERFPQTRIGVHLHNDSGLGVAVSLAGVEAGASLVQGTLNGVGERVGNANLTSIIPNLALKMNRRLSCGKHLQGLKELSHEMDDLANLDPDAKAPFVGRSAFAHKGGVHANAAKKVAHSYEHIRPELVGNRQRVLLSDLSGGSSVVMKANELGIELEEKSDEMRSFLALLKEREYQGYAYEQADASFEVLINRHFKKTRDFFHLVGFRVITEVVRETGEVVSEASVKLKVGDTVHHTVADSQGPVGALDHAMRKALETVYPTIHDIELQDYKVRILDTGKGADAIVSVLIQSGAGDCVWWTSGAGTNIIEASYEALRDSFLYALQRGSFGS